MSVNTVPDLCPKSARTVVLLELAVPLLSFGGVLLAFLAGESGSLLDARYFALGCVMSSCILSWLAWIRPRKDIVALSMPIYAVIFFIVPSDLAVTLILEFLYAVSLTILLIRLKIYFGPALLGADGRTDVLAQPLEAYCAGLRDTMPGLSQESAHLAAVCFLQFSCGEYPEVIRAAGTALETTGGSAGWPAVGTAFAILQEQAALLESSARRPEEFCEFSESDVKFLAKPVPPKRPAGERFEAALENALLLLFASAWNASESDHPVLISGAGFALRLIEE